METYLRVAELFGMQAPPVEDVRLPRAPGLSAEESALRGRQAMDAGDLAAAIEHFKNEVRQLADHAIDGRLDLAGALEAADMAPQALRQYERALKMRGDVAEAHVGLSQLYKRNARQRDSIQELERAITLEPGNAFLHYKLAEVFRGLGERKRALHAAQGSVAAAPDQAFYHFWVGDLLIEMRRFDEALDALRAALELSPGDDHYYLRAAVAFWGTGLRDKAVYAVRLASELDPDKHVYQGLLEVFLERMGKCEEAALEHESAQKMDGLDRDKLRRTLLELGLTGC